MAFMHGAQDGQKFMGVFHAGHLPGQRADSDVTQLCHSRLADDPLLRWSWRWAPPSAATASSKSVGMDMVKLEKYQGFAADLAAAACLLISSLYRRFRSAPPTPKPPPSWASGASKGRSFVNWGVVKDMVLTWVLTFPACGLIGYPDGPAVPVYLLSCTQSRCGILA